MTITSLPTPIAVDLQDRIGRESLDDIASILAIATPDDGAVEHLVSSTHDTRFSWDYTAGRPALTKLYEKAKTSQWNATTDLDWSIEVDQEKVVVANVAARGGRQLDVSGTPLATWGEREWLQFGIESQNWTLSQFLHGEQGALLATARLVETVPFMDAKFYASTQVVDEARHVEVFSRYLDEKLSSHYPINAHLQLLLDDVLADPRWDITYLGMQVMVEGLALASFGYMSQLSTEPLLKKLLRYVMSDEARHVAFGVLSLKDFYGELTNAEIRERQEFAYEAAVRMRDRFLQQEVFERMGVNPKDVLPLVIADEERTVFQTMLFAKIVPNCAKLGLLDAGDGWLRDRFGELGVLGFEHELDTGAEYASLDAVAADRVA